MFCKIAAGDTCGKGGKTMKRMTLMLAMGILLAGLIIPLAAFGQGVDPTNHGRRDRPRPNPLPVPEAATILLLGTGLAGLAAYKKLKK